MKKRNGISTFKSAGTVCRKKIEKIVDFFRAHKLAIAHVLTTEWTKKAVAWNI
jgi:hypothetical protein